MTLTPTTGVPVALTLLSSAVSVYVPNSPISYPGLAYPLETGQQLAPASGAPVVLLPV